MQLPDTIGYWLGYAQRCFAAAFSEVLRAHCVERGKTYVITPPHWAIMKLFSHNDEQTISMLAQHLGLDAPSVTNVVKRLEQSGLVERRRDHEDQRVVKVSLTAEGQDIIHSLDPVVTAFNERLFPEDQRQAFLMQLQDLVTTVKMLVPSTGARFDFFLDHLRRQNQQSLGELPAEN